MRVRVGAVTDDADGREEGSQQRDGAGDDVVRRPPQQRGRRRDQHAAEQAAPEVGRKAPYQQGPDHALKDEAQRHPWPHVLEVSGEPRAERFQGKGERGHRVGESHRATHRMQVIEIRSERQLPGLPAEEQPAEQVGRCVATMQYPSDIGRVESGERMAVDEPEQPSKSRHYRRHGLLEAGPTHARSLGTATTNRALLVEGTRRRRARRDGSGRTRGGHRAIRRRRRLP